MDHKVSVIIERNDKRYLAHCPEIPECKADGKSIEDALNRMRKELVKFLQKMEKQDIVDRMSNEIYTTTLSISFD